MVVPPHIRDQARAVELWAAGIASGRVLDLGVAADEVSDGAAALREYVVRELRLRPVGRVAAGRGVRCPRCSRVSWNPNDVAHGYCGWCHDWTSPPAGVDAVYLAQERGVAP